VPRRRMTTWIGRCRDGGEGSTRGSQLGPPLDVGLDHFLRTSVRCRNRRESVVLTVVRETRGSFGFGIGRFPNRSLGLWYRLVEVVGNTETGKLAETARRNRSRPGAIALVRHSRRIATGASSQCDDRVDVVHSPGLSNGLSDLGRSIEKAVRPIVGRLRNSARPQLHVRSSDRNDAGRFGRVSRARVPERVLD